MVTGGGPGADASGATLRVTLLGTGTPLPVPDRFGAATLVEAGGQALLFDAGRGAATRLYQLGIPLGAVGPVFLTHFHSDHVVGLADLWLTGWLAAPWAGRRTPFQVTGPTGTRALMAGLRQAHAADLAIRLADEGLPPAGAAVEVREFDRDGVVHDRDGVRVHAFAVDHGEAIRPAYGYRIEHGGCAVVLSGDTRFSEAVIRQATGAELLIHEVAAAPPELARESSVRRVLAHHCSPEEAGEVFRRAEPGLAVLTHMVLPARLGAEALTEAALVTRIRDTYQGPLVVGADLMRLVVRRGEVARE